MGKRQFDIILKRAVAGIMAAIIGVIPAAEVCAADGVWNGKGSYSEVGGEGEYNSDIARRRFNVLEILPTEKKAVIGFTIAGCEPFDVGEEFEVGGEVITNAQMKEAYMDALINKNPGSSSANDNNTIQNDSKLKEIEEMAGKIDEDSPTEPYTIEKGKVYKGYYKNVGNNKGVFRVESDDGNGNAVMQSKFYYKGNNDFNYIFVYSDKKSSTTGDINVVDHKRFKYINNDMFIKDFLEESDPAEWRKTHTIEVTTKAPQNVTLKDIDKADVIIVNNGNKMVYHETSLHLHNRVAGVSNESTDGSKVFSKDIDFKYTTEHPAFELVSRIYERVVVREDVAFLASRNCMSDTTFDTNMRKLMCMLYYVDKMESYNTGNKDENGNDIYADRQVSFAGRDIFMNFMKRYVDEPGKEFMTRRNEYENNKDKDYDTSKLYPDYRAPSLRTGEYYQGKPYMHFVNDWHVGHPLVLDKGSAISGGRYGYIDDAGQYIEDGILRPIYEAGDSAKVQMQRTNPNMYNNAGIDYYVETMEIEDTSRYYVKSPYWNGYDQNSNGDYLQIGGPVYDIYGNQVSWTEPTYEKRNGRKAYKNVAIYCHDAYNSMSNATDFVYIDDWGTLQISDKYSSSKGSYWYKIDPDPNGGINDEFAYRTISWDAASYRSWPWITNGTFMGKWLFHSGDNGNSANLHMWYDYVAWGSYRPGNIPNGDQTYKNESLSIENGMLKSGLLRDALSGRKVKRENEGKSNIIENVKKSYYMSMNIVNGDSVTPELATGGAKDFNRNKTIYINRYELDGMTTLPINIEIVTSHPIKSISVSKADRTGNKKGDIATYSSASGVLKGGGTLNTVTLTDETDKHEGYDSSGKPKNYDSEKDYYKYYMSGEIKLNKANFSTKANNTILIEVWNTVSPDPAKDLITIVTRDFFGLN